MAPRVGDTFKSVAPLSLAESDEYDRAEAELSLLPSTLEHAKGDAFLMEWRTRRRKPPEKMVMRAMIETTFISQPPILVSPKIVIIAKYLIIQRHMYNEIRFNHAAS